MRASRPSRYKSGMEPAPKRKIIEQQLKPLPALKKLSKLPVVWTNEGEYRQTCQFASLIG